MQRKDMLYPNIAKSIRELRATNNLTQSEFAKKIDIQRTAVSHYENGMRMPEHKLLERISKEFNVSISYLLGEEQTISTQKLYKNPNPRYLPILGTVSAGILETPIELRDELLEVPSYIKFSDDKLLAIRCNGESMNKVIPNGYNIVVVKAIHAVIKDGDIVVFRQENEFSVKRFFDMGDVLIFKPESNDESFKTIIIDKQSTADNEIIGKVLCATMNF